MLIRLYSINPFYFHTHTHTAVLSLPLCVGLSFLRLHPDGPIQANHLTIDHGVFSNGGHKVSKLSRVAQA